MPGPSPNSQLDGVSVVTRGMNSGVAPRLLPPNQVAMAVNLTFRNGLPRTRPVWRKVALTYGDEALHVNATEKLFQCASFYQGYGNKENCLVASVGGHLFRYLVGSSNVVQDVSVATATTVSAPGFTIPAIGATVSITVASTAGWAAGDTLSIAGVNYQVQAVTGATTATVLNLDGVAGVVIAAGNAVTAYTDLNNPINPDCWMWQAEDFLIVNNGQADPLFFDGAGTRRSLGAAGQELPAGCMGTYVQGRVWMALPNAGQKPSQEYMAGDLVYSHGFTDGYNGRGAVLRTEENTFFSGGGSFSVPVDAGPITAMNSVAIADTSLGQGPLQVMTASAVFSVQVPLDRTQWAATEYPIVTVGLPGYGALSQRGTVRVNGDLWYRSHDGLRSYQIGRRDQNTWVHTPLSIEVERILTLDSEAMLPYGSGVVFNNRLLETCSPFQSARGTAHRGIVALDFNGISTLISRSDPAYDGLWTGLRVLQVVKGTFNGTERCFAFALDACDRICLYELMADGIGWFDWNGTGTRAVECAYETRSMGWKDGGNVLKRLQCADVYLDRLAGNDTVLFDFKYRSDEDPTWVDWHSFSLCAPVEDCDVSGCPTFDNVREQYRTFLRLPEPRDTCSPLTRRMTRTGYEFQVRMSWAGFAQLNRLHVWTEAFKDSVVQACPTSESCTLLKGCEEPWFGYEVENGTCADPVVDTITATVPPVPGEDPPPEQIIPTPGGPDDPGEPDEPDQPGTHPGDVPVVPDQPDPQCNSGCVAYSAAIAVTDPFGGAWGYVGIAPLPGMTPEDYITMQLGSTVDAQACIQAWANAVWAAWAVEKAALGITTSVEFIAWRNVPSSGLGFMGWQVFPDQAGGYNGVVDLNTKLVIVYCQTN